MDEVTMLQVLNEYGADAGSDYNDGEDVMGWFGWSIDDNHVLAVTFQDGEGQKDSAKWQLTPIKEGKSGRR